MVEEAIKQCKENGLRVTVGLKSILKVLVESELPLSLVELEKNKTLKELCDRATIFRTLQRLEGIGLLRRLNFAKSGAKFSLNTGSKHKEYLICSECGEVQELAMSCPVHSLEKEIAEKTGFSSMSHELTFYGLCKSCA